MQSEEEIVKYLYVDNFRGFRKTSIPLQDVNFLVGENSTGKTSLLSLVALIRSPQFWFSSGFDFNSVDSRLGHFNDLVSVSSDNKNYFRIGFMADIEEDQGDEREGALSKDFLIGFLMTFVSRNGLPVLRKLTYTRGAGAIHLSLDGKAVRWRADDIDSRKLNTTCAAELFSNWSDFHAQPARGYSKLSEPADYDLGVLDAMLHINRELNKKKKTKYRPFFYNWLHEIVWLAPVRTKPRRTYDDPMAAYSAEGAHTPYVIRNILDRPKEKARFEKFIKQIGADSGLFESISVKKYGKTNTSPFELDVVLGGRPLSVTNVGYGVSQSLPLIVELFQRPDKTTFVIQQPEVHLHPRAQAAFGDVIFRLAENDQKNFFIETHSDFTIDRFRLNYKSQTDGVPKSQLLFFERTSEGNQVTPINIERSGQYSSEQPLGFRDFFFREDLRLLDL